MTRNIDVVMDLRESDAETLTNLFIQDYYIDREAIVRAIAQRSIFNLIHQDSVIKVAGIVRKGDYAVGQ